MLAGPPASVCTHHTRCSRRGRTHYLVCGLLWSHSSMATPVRARMDGASGVVGMQKCWRDFRRRFARNTCGGRAVDAHSTRGLDVNDRILLWPPTNAHYRPVQAVRMGCTNARGTPGVGLHPPHPVVASSTHTVRVVWTSMARCMYGHPSTRTNGHRKRRGWDVEQLVGPPTLVCTHHALWSRRGRTQSPMCGHLWANTSMAIPVRARMVSTHGVVGMQKCLEDPRRRFQPTIPCCRVVEVRITRCVDVYGHISLCVPQYAQELQMHAARLGCRNIAGTPKI